MCGLPNVEPIGRVREALYASIGFATETKHTKKQRIAMKAAK